MVNRSAPNGPIEDALVGLWISALGKVDVHSNTNFFEHGGNETQASLLVTDAEQVFGVSLPPEVLKHSPTPSLLGHAILKARTDQACLLPPLIPISRDVPLQLSFSQERMWFMHQLDPQGTAYNVCGAVKTSGPLNHNALEQSLDRTIQKNEVLRTVFPVVDGQPVQKILPCSHCSIEWIDLQDTLQDGRQEQALALAEECIRRSFDIARGPLFYLRVIQLEAEVHFVVFNFHHIIIDAWGISVFINELAFFYNALIHDTEITLPESSIQFADYAAWQRKILSGERFEKQMAYWLEKLRGAAAFDIPSMHPRPALQTYKGSFVHSVLESETIAKLGNICEEENATIFMALLAAFYVLLYRYTGQTDITFAVPIANRNWSATEMMIGTLVNTLLMRVDLTGNPTFRQALKRVRQVALEAYDHQDLPFTQLIARLQPDRDTSRTPLAQIMFNMLNVPVETVHFEGVDAEFLQVDRMGVQFDLSLNLSEEPDGYQTVLEYNTDLFDRDTIERMLGHYQHLIDAACAHPEIPVSQLEMLSTQERDQFARWNATELDYPSDKTLVQLFEEKVRFNPSADALYFDNQTLSYAELNQRANQLAHYLRQYNVRPGEVVGLCVDRSLDMVIGILGILKAGAAYLPLDPAYPLERLSFMLSDSGARVLIGHAIKAEKLADLCEQVIYIDQDAGTIIKQEVDDLPAEITSNSPLYVLYTSGSTGQPKGVVGSHRAAVNRFSWMWRVFPFLPGEVACQKTSFNFVDSVWELFGPLLQGVPSVILRDEQIKDTPRLISELARWHVTRIVLVPSLLKAVLETQYNLAQKLPKLSLWICSGEALPVDLVQRFYMLLPKSCLLNLYGSSEVAGDVTWYDTRLLPPDLTSVPIGIPVDNTQMYVLDAYLNPLPISMPGEIYAGGDNLAIGYHKRSDLTMERFLPDPFCQQPGNRLYCTGDLGYFLPDGNLVCLGRRDLQVKVRGVRIELNEIENLLLQHPDVQECAVDVYRLGNVAQSLVGYIAARSTIKPAPEQIRAFLRTKLPEYMVPERFVFLDRLPQTPNGKLDRKSLQAMQSVNTNTERRVHPGRSPLEEKLIALWEEVLNIRPIGRDDNFFEFGGHSLLIVTLLFRIQQELGIKLPVHLLFKYPTVSGLLDAIANTAQDVEWISIVPIHAQGTRLPFFCVHGINGGVTGYTELAQCLGSDQPYYGLQARGLDGRTSPAYSIEEMAEQYIQEIQSEVQPHGPYLLGGYCFGGLVAYEMARQLEDAGEQVAMVALMETPLYHKPQDFFHQFRYPHNAVRFLKNLPLWLASENGRRQRHRARMERFLKSNHNGAAVTTGQNIAAMRQSVIEDSSLIYPGLQNVSAAHIQALQDYQPRPYSRDLDIFRVKTSRLSWPFDEDLGWGRFAGQGTHCHLIPGDHDNFLQHPFVERLALILRECIDRKTSLLKQQ